MKEKDNILSDNLLDNISGGSGYNTLNDSEEQRINSLSTREFYPAVMKNCTKCGGSFSASRIRGHFMNCTGTSKYNILEN
mgnify:CR=1 FL=1